MTTPAIRALAWRFVAGESLDAGLTTLRSLNARGIQGTLNYVGTHVRNKPEAIEAEALGLDVRADVGRANPHRQPFARGSARILRRRARRPQHQRSTARENPGNAHCSGQCPLNTSVWNGSTSAWSRRIKACNSPSASTAWSAMRRKKPVSFATMMSWLLE